MVVFTGGSPEVEKEQRDALERQRANFLRKKYVKKGEGERVDRRGTKAGR